MNEKDNLNQEQDSNSTPSNLPVEVKENKLKNFVEDLKDPMFSWRLRESFRDFTDSISMSAVGQAFRRVINSVTGAVSNFTNKMKESAENRRNNNPSKSGISVSTIETQAPSKSEVIMPQAAQKTAKEAPSNITIIGTPAPSRGGIINNAKSAKDIDLEVAENGIKLEDMEVDESVISQEAHEKDSTQVEDINKNTISPVIDSSEINFGQPVKDKETKTTDDIEK